MKTIQASCVFGNFKWTAEAEVTDLMLLRLAEFGMTQVLQRVPSSNAEKALAYPGKGVKRPVGFKRTDIGYSESARDLIQTFLESAIVDMGDEQTATLGAVVTVEEYVATGAEIKYAEEKKILARHDTAGDLVEWLEEKCKFGGEATDGEGWTLECLQAVKRVKDAAVKAAMLAMNM